MKNLARMSICDSAQELHETGEYVVCWNGFALRFEVIDLAFQVSVYRQKLEIKIKFTYMDNTPIL